MSNKSKTIEKLTKQEKTLNYNVKLKGRTFEFLNKVESLNGYINHGDGLALVHHYLLHFSANF